MQHYWFQVYKMAIRHFYNVQSDYPDKSGTHLTPYKDLLDSCPKETQGWNYALGNEHW